MITRPVSLAARIMDMREEEKSSLEIIALLEGYPFLKQILQNIKQVVWVLDQETAKLSVCQPIF